VINQKGDFGMNNGTGEYDGEVLIAKDYVAAFGPGKMRYIASGALGHFKVSVSVKNGGHVLCDGIRTRKEAEFICQLLNMAAEMAEATT
jgi:hypothetical protein